MFFRVRLIEIQVYLATQKKILIKIGRNADEKKYYYFLETKTNGENIYIKILKANAIKNDLFNLLDLDVVANLNTSLFLQFNCILGLTNEI